MMWKLDKWAFEQDLLRSGSCRYDVVGQEGVWHAASAITPKDIRRQEGRAVHVFQSGGRCLPTTRAINNLNQHLPHAVYPGDRCPFGCPDVGDEFHTYYVCAYLTPCRRQTVSDMYDGVIGIVREACKQVDTVWSFIAQRSEICMSVFFQRRRRASSGGKLHKRFAE